jgi:hypothetical protein
MRPLSATAASRCEHATSTRCRCRCGGAFHGAARYSYDDPEAAYLLDEGDPHLPRVPPGRGVQLRLRPCVEVEALAPVVALFAGTPALDPDVARLTRLLAVVEAHEQGGDEGGES